MRTLYFILAISIATVSSCTLVDQLFLENCDPNPRCKDLDKTKINTDTDKPFFKGELVLTVTPKSSLVRDIEGTNVSVNQIKTLMQDVQQDMIKQGKLKRGQSLDATVKKCLCDENIFLIGIDPLLNAEENVKNVANSRPEMGDEGGGFTKNYVIQNSDKEENIPPFTKEKPTRFESHSNSTNAPIVAILDSGLDPSAFLNGNSAGIFSKMTSDNQICNDINDINGYNFVDPTPNNSIMDNHGHGTAVALAYKYGLSKINQAAWQQQRLLPVKVLNDCGVGSVYSAACGLAYAKKRNAKIVNLSFGMGFNNYHLEYAISQMSDVAIVCSAGNKRIPLNESNHFPSGYASEYFSEVSPTTPTSTKNPMSNVYEVMAIKKDFSRAGADSANRQLASYSNLRHNSFAEIGNNVGPIINSAYDDTVVDCCMEGTSFAAPMLTAALSDQLINGNIITDKSLIMNAAYNHQVTTTALGPIMYYSYFNAIAL